MLKRKHNDRYMDCDSKTSPDTRSGAPINLDKPTSQGTLMNRKIASLVIACATLSAAGAVQAKGCLEGAAVGGVAGHEAGKHGAVGAAGGCAVGHHEANKKQKAQQAAGASQAAGK
jgi:hypothetical protein